VGFEKFGKVGFVSETKAADFVNHLEQGKLMVTRCKKCGTIFSPPKIDCSECLSSEVEWVEVKGKGKLISYTTLQFAPTGFEDDLPYALGLVEFDEGLRIFGRLSKDIPQEELRVGLEVKPASVKITPDRISYEFQKA